MKVLQKGHKCLEQRCPEIFETLDPLLIDEMKKTMIENKGVGLAANQVGIEKRFFVANIGSQFGVFINPSIISHGKDEIEQAEGCLSILGEDGKSIYKPKKRWAIIDVMFWDEKKNHHKVTLKRFDARIFQHEMDHLDGRLCQ